MKIVRERVIHSADTVVLAAWQSRPLDCGPFPAGVAN
jgi:hypothetical protein